MKPVKEPSMDHALLKKLTDTVLENLENEQFGVGELSEQVGISRSHLHRKLKLLKGKSVSQFIREVRLEEAMKLLRNDVATVSEIAFRVGFNSPSYFNKAFQNHYKIAPGELKKNPEIISDYGLQDNNEKKDRSTPPIWKRHVVKIAAIAAVSIILIISFFFLLLPQNPREYSVAVLPLDNLTGQEENDYFVEGIHGALIGKLGQISSLRVISRTSTLRYQESNMLLQDIASELGVNTIVEGAITIAGDSLRILLRLVQAFPDERHLLAQEYHDTMEKALNIQSNAAYDIAQKINVELSEKEEQLLADARMVNPETYKNYLRGMYYLNRGTEESFQTALNYFQQAIARDPGDPLAYADMAMGYAHIGHGLSADEAFIRATKAADKALRLDPTLDEVHTAMALLYLYDKWDWEKSNKAFENSLAANPNNEIAHAHYAWYHELFGDMKSSIYHAEKAIQIEPFSSVYHSWLALLYFETNEYEKAELMAKKSLELQEDSFYGLVVLGWISLKKGNPEEAIEYHERLPKTGSHSKVFLGHTYVQTGQSEKALILWKELEEESKHNWVNPVHRGMMASYLGFTDKAFELLEEGYEQKVYPSTYLNFYPATKYIRDDPRYVLLMKKLNLPYREKVVAKRPQ